MFWVRYKYTNSLPNDTGSNLFVTFRWNEIKSMESFREYQSYLQEEIEKVLEAAMADDYDHLVFTLAEHCENP